MIDFPEGVELYDLVVADTTADAVTFAVPDIAALDEVELIEVRRMRGPWGWTKELRIFVVFDGASVPIFETPPITDAEISLECASGDRILAFEREERINRRPYDPLHRTDEHDPDDPKSRGW
jgi:hypothetical protein